jgi:hypothetical protein
MVQVIAGTDTYGAVRKVRATPIVTRFAMLQLLPVYPLESYYLVRLGPGTFRGIPFLVSHASQEVHGLRLARLDRLSVAMAYLRALATVLVLPGTIMFFVLFVMVLTGSYQSPDWFAQVLILIVSVMFGVGMLIGGTSYLATYRVDAREKKIREICGSVLGIAADPANIAADSAVELGPMIKAAMADANIANPSRLLQNPQEADELQAALLLVACRMRIATGGDRGPLEQAVDQLLNVL